MAGSLKNKCFPLRHPRVPTTPRGRSRKRASYQDRLAPPPYVPPTASPSTTVAEAKEVEEQDSVALSVGIRDIDQPMTNIATHFDVGR